jgi:hypothetical protein
VLDLSAHWRSTRVAHHSQLLSRGPRLDSATPAVVTDAIAAVFPHLIVVNVVDGRGHVGHRAVVVQSAVIPISAVIATARISIAVVDAAVVTNVRTPVARVPMVVAVIVAPPGRRPKRTYVRSHNPRAGYPVITGAGIAPVAWRPNVIVAGSGRLAVLGKRGRRFGGLDRLLVGGILIVILGIVRITCRGRVALTGRGCRRCLRRLSGLIH